MLTETLKHRKAVITQQVEHKTNNYNKMVGVEDAIKALKEQDKRNLRDHNNFLERTVQEKLARRELLQQRMQQDTGGVGASSASASASTSTSASKEFAAAKGLRLLANSAVAETDTSTEGDADGLSEGCKALSNDDENTEANSVTVLGMDSEGVYGLRPVRMELD